MHIINVSDFQREVIEKSYTLPVLVDFWAAWCQPCLMLAPILERLAQENQGKWILAKVNVDEHQHIAMQYGVRGIPNVKLFHKGQPIAEFTGVFPENYIRQWLQNHLPKPETAVDKALKQILPQLQQRNFAPEFYESLQNLHQQEPQNPEVLLWLVRLAMLYAPLDSQEVEQWIQALAKDPDRYQQSTYYKGLWRLISQWQALKDHPVKERLQSVGKDLRNGAMEEALKTLIKVVSLAPAYEDGIARKATLAIFDLLGNDHPLVKKYRKEFEMALF